MTQRILEAAQRELQALGYSSAEIIGDGIWVDVWYDNLSDTRAMQLHEQEIHLLAEEHDEKIYLQECRLKKQEQQNKEQISELWNKLADIKYDLQQVLDALQSLEHDDEK